MDILGFDEYEESLTDGLQVLRYNKTTAYIPHLDWIDDYGKKQEHDCKSFLYCAASVVVIYFYQECVHLAHIALLTLPI